MATRKQLCHPNTHRKEGISLCYLNIKDNVQSGKKRCHELVLLEQF